MARLDNKVAVITGGGSGIGQATCLRFAEEGARVMIFDFDERGGRESLAKLNAIGADADFCNVDVRSEDSVKTGVEVVLRRWGRVDVLVNNAGIPGANKLAHDCTVDEFNAVFAVNVLGVFLCTKHVLPTMMQNKSGSIVNFSSIYGLVGNDDLPLYHATKGAVLMMTKTDAISYAKHGIRVNAVHPGSVKTAMFMKVGEAYPGGLDKYISVLSKQHPLRIGEPVDVANCVLFLASDEAQFVTGASLVCDGGYTAQ